MSDREILNIFNFIAIVKDIATPKDQKTFIRAYHGGNI